MKAIILFLAFILTSYMSLNPAISYSQEEGQEAELPQIEDAAPLTEAEANPEEVVAPKAETSKEDAAAVKTLTPPIDLEAMDVDGKYKARAQAPAPAPTPTRRDNASDRLRKLRVALEKRNELMVRRKIEEIRVRQELIMMRQVEKAMNQTMKAMDKIN